MSHFKVIVIGDNAEEQLAKFDETLLVPHTISKEEHIEKAKMEIKKYSEGLYSEYLKDPEEYIKNCNNENHVKYISEDFPKKLNYSDEELYQESIKYIDKEDINEDGSTNCTYNPNSKWDWYEVGGRYAGSLVLKESCLNNYEKPNYSWGWSDFDKEKLKNNTDSAYVKDIDFEKSNLLSYAVVKNGEWFEKGTMGWFGISVNEDSEWEQKQKKLLENLDEDTLITVIDCHI